MCSGGTPGAFDRLLDTKLGASATDHIARGELGVLVGLTSGTMSCTPLADMTGRHKKLDPRLLERARVVAT
jgi:6-phosphofructokinase